MAGIGQHKAAGTAAFTPVTSLTTAAPGGNTTTGSAFVILVFTGGSVSGTPVQDSFSNTYTLKASASVIFGGQNVYAYLCDNGTGGASHTATVNFSSSTSGAIFFVEVTGATSSSYDTSNTISNNGAGASQSGAPVTTTNAADLILSMICSNGTGDTITDTSGWNSIIENLGFGSSGAANGALSWQVESATGTYSDTYGISGSSDATGGITIALKSGAVPPVITAQPTQQTVTAGSTATFSETDTGGTSWQWYESAPVATYPPPSPGLYTNVPASWGSIGGATSSSYTTPTLSSSNTGQWYYCAVTNANGTTNTVPARVWVTGLGPEARGLQ